MRDILKKIAPTLRNIGFRGSGQNFRKTQGDWILLINFQGSTSGDRFFVNLGAQPVFIPAEGYADLKRLKEYECILRTRVGSSWAWEMSDVNAQRMLTELLSVQEQFFGHAQTLKAAIEVHSAEKLITDFSEGKRAARAALHLARAALALGNHRKADELARHGLVLASERGTILLAELQSVLVDVQSRRS